MDAKAALAALKEFGSPLYVYDDAVLRSRCRALRGALPLDGVHFLYAVKANANPALLSVIAEEGLDFDTVSEGEVRALLRIGIPPARISYNGNNVTRDELAAVADLGVGMIVDSLSQLETVAALGLVETLGVRLNTGVGGGHHRHVITGGPESKFGIEPADLDEALATAARYRVAITTLHQHIGSGILDASLLAEAVERLLPFAARLPDLEAVDFGGGFGIPYRAQESALDLGHFAARVTPALTVFRAERGLDVRFCFEPGRFVVGPTGALLVTVTSVKQGAEHVFVGTDSGFNHLVRPTMYGAFHRIDNLTRPDGSLQTVRVAGNVCESGDLLAVDRALPECEVGDVLAIRDAGAYGFSMASTYNLRPRPAEVLLVDGESPRLIRRRETIDDLLR